MRCTLIPISCCGACRNRIIISTNYQCAAHVLRREDLQFYGAQPDQRTTGTPLFLVIFSCGSMPRKNKNVRWQRVGLCVGLRELGRICGLIIRCRASRLLEGMELVNTGFQFFQSGLSIGFCTGRASVTCKDLNYS